MNAAVPPVGIIANPVSARDIRRIVAHAGNMQITDRANIVLRLLAGLGAVGIEQVLIMPENSGIRHHVVRGLERSARLEEGRFPAAEYLDMPISASTGDSIEAARRMREADVAAIIVLGGDGTHPRDGRRRLPRGGAAQPNADPDLYPHTRPQGRVPVECL